MLDEKEIKQNVNTIIICADKINSKETIELMYDWYKQEKKNAYLALDKNDKKLFATSLVNTTELTEVAKFLSSLYMEHNRMLNSIRETIKKRAAEKKGD